MSTPVSKAEGGRGLPPLPEMNLIVTEKPGFRFESKGYTDKQMHDYAREAIAHHNKVARAQVKSWRNRMKNQPGQPMENLMMDEIKELRKALGAAK